MNLSISILRQRQAEAAGLPRRGPAIALACFGGGKSSTSSATTQASTQNQFGVSDQGIGVSGEGNQVYKDSGNTTNVDASNRQSFNTSTDINASDNSVRNTDNSIQNSDSSVHDSSDRSTNTFNVSDQGAIAAGAGLGKSAIELSGTAIGANTGLAGKVVDVNSALAGQIVSAAQDFTFKAQKLANQSTNESLNAFNALNRDALAAAQNASGNVDSKTKLFALAIAAAAAVMLFRNK